MILVQTAISIVLALGGAQAAAPQIVETPAFRLTFPQGWQRLANGAPIRISGPDHTIATISSVNLPADPTDIDARQARGNALLDFVAAVDKRTSASNLQVNIPWRVSALPDGALLRETMATSQDQLTYTSNAIYPGKQALVFLTVEGPRSAVKHYTTAREALLAITWK